MSSTAERIECPVCAEARKRCRLCRGLGSVDRASIQQLCAQMEHVADAMQSGDDERAANAARIAGRIAARCSLKLVLSWSQ